MAPCPCSVTAPESAVIRHLPNAICLLRIALVWPIVAAIERGAWSSALTLFVIAAVSDGLDGYLAKRFGWTSDLGRVLDPVADKLLLVAVFLACTWQGLVPAWLAAAAIARDVMIGAGSLVFRMWFGPLQGHPTALSKVNTALQIIVIVGAMSQATFAWPLAEPLFVLAGLTLMTTLCSGADYLTRFWRRAWALTAPTR